VTLPTAVPLTITVRSELQPAFDDSAAVGAGAALAGGLACARSIGNAKASKTRMRMPVRTALRKTGNCFMKTSLGGIQFSKTTG
jgi:hypothetical protein